MDCGPACLRMVAKHYGRNFRLQNLRELCEINKEGVSMLGMSDAIEKIGFRSLGVKLSIAGLKEAELPEEKKKDSVKEFNLKKGLIVCIVSGILSAGFNYGIEAGSALSEEANKIWQAAHADQSINYIFRNNVVYVVLLWGGLASNLFWCVLLNVRNKSLADYGNRKAPLLKNYLFCALAGTTWFLQYFFYGMGESKLGNGASSWILHMAFIILAANCWGFVLKEWSGVSNKTRRTILAGIAIIILAVIMVGYGNSLKP